MLNPLTFYKCISEETRLKSVLLITLKKELCVCDLTEALDLSQPKVSRHLAELRKFDILRDDRRGKWVYYGLSPDLPEWALGVLQTTLSQSPDYLSDAVTRLTEQLPAEELEELEEAAYA